MNLEIKKRVLLADDHPFICRAVRALLEHEPDLQVIGEAKDGLQALAEIERLKPDVAIIDLTMPGLCGVEVIRRITGQGLSTRIIVLSMHADDFFVSQALNAGASAYVTKSSPPNTLLTALREVIAGRNYLSPPLAQRAIQAYFQQVTQRTGDVYDSLTNREREVLQLVVEGLSNAQIAELLNISVRTAEIHRANMMHKLGTNSLIDLLRFAARRGIVTLN